MESGSSSGFEEGKPHPLSRGERILFRFQRDFGYLYDFQFNVAIGCDRGQDDVEGRDLGIAWITPDLAHHVAKFAVEIDGIQHRLEGGTEDADRDGLLAREGWQVLRIPSYEVYDTNLILDVLDRLERGVFGALLEKDIKRDIRPHMWRYYPVAVRCTRCGRPRPGHKVGSGYLCIDCLSPWSAGPYLPPRFECAHCGREMAGPDDVEIWPHYGDLPVRFECPEVHLQPEGEYLYE